MAEVFGRIYELTIGSPQHTVELVKEARPAASFAPELAGEIFVSEFVTPFGEHLDASSMLDKVDYQVIPAGNTAKQWTDIHFEASIQYTSEGNSPGTNEQPAEFKLYNLSPESVKFIREGGVIFLKAGYKQTPSNSNQEIDGLPLIYSGQIIRTRTYRQGENTITQLICGDAFAVRNNIKVSRTYDKGSSYEGIILDLLQDLSDAGIPTGHFIRRESQQSFPLSGDSPRPMAPKIKADIETLVLTGYNIEGDLFTKLEEVCGQVGYKAYISLGRVYVEPRLGPQRILPAVVITEDVVKEGIRPEGDLSGATIEEGNNDGGYGVSISLVLNGNITLDKYVSIEYGEFQGVYKITSVSHELSYEGDKWETVVSATRA